MIDEFIQAWNTRKENLYYWFKQTDQSELSYEDILKAILDEVINPYTDDKWDSEKIHVIDDGDYQGCQIFVVPMDTCQPSPYQYLTTYQDYGSCSGCDLLEGIRNYEHERPTEEQVKQYMMLALHLLQRCRYFRHFETYIEEE